MRRGSPTLFEVVHTGPVADISARLLRCIQLDFPHHAQVVIGKLDTLDHEVAESGQNPERILAAVVRPAAGRLDRLDHAVAVAGQDWRDVLVGADLADHAWAARLSAWLDPPAQRQAAPGPAVSGELVDANARRWRVRRRHIDLRMVKRLIRRPDVVVMLGESGGLSLRAVEPGHRGLLWETVRHAYAGPGGKPSVTNQVQLPRVRISRRRRGRHALPGTTRLTVPT